MFFGSWPAGLYSHPDTVVRIQELTAQLQQPSPLPDLYLTRASAYIEHEQFAEASADYRSYSLARPDQPTGTLGQARMALYAGKTAEADHILTTHTERFPTDSVAMMLWSQVAEGAEGQKNLPVAIDRCRRAMALRPQPLVVDWVRLSSLVRSSDAAGLAAARHVVAQGLAKYPAESQLLSLHGTLAEEAADWPTALAVHQQQTATLRRQEVPLAKKAVLLEKAGRPTEAATAYRDCLRVIDALPDFLRPQEHVQKVATEAHAALKRLGLEISSSSLPSSDGPSPVDGVRVGPPLSPPSITR